ncbi:hypothetical protein [Spiroplasma culicicola]|uniref:Transmembrane protein n=1 Tax=Spiroplasma culicicola AES-1 TaxID=1276246 RepID=W6AHA7_9MOLU|nr:hypothetical protein [Spiroplasma culicicola]AHI53074.1 hypothetical protein SCULI_v1c07330 [Spiroplasma culicicola AES-1]
MWIQINTIVSDVLSAVGLLIIIFSPLFFTRIQRKVLDQRLHTRVDGDKLFEKLKYDLKLSKLTGVDRKRLYRDVHYARTIFKGAMEYNSRDLLWYFNELYAKKFIHNTIRKKSWIHTWIWIGIILVIGGGSYLDIFHWLFDMQTMTSTSGIVSIWTLFIFASLFTALNKFMEYFKIKGVVNDEIRQINLAKKEKVWKDYKIIFWCSISMFGIGFLFIFINIFIR